MHPSKRIAIAAALVTLLFSACASAPHADPVVVMAGDNARSFAGITEIGTGFFGSTKARGDGSFEIGNSGMLWKNRTDADRNISIRPEVISRAWLTCAKRDGANLCLDLGVKTLTGNEYHFRDTNWEGGVNTVILDAFDHMKRVYPQVQFDQRDVKEIH